MSDPLECKFEREGFQDLKIAQLLFNTQIVALVSDSEKNKVTIWDEYQLRKVEAIVVSQPVLAVKLRKDKIVVVMKNALHMYNLADLDFFGALQTVDNENGICALNSTTDTFVLAVLSDNSPMKAFIQVLNNERNQKEIRCHSQPIAQLALNHDGRFLATVSQEGKRIKIFNTNSGQ